MSVPAVAAQLEVSPQRVRAMVRSGVLSGEQVGGRWFIDPASMPSVSRRAGQPLSARVAWGLVDLADGKNAKGLSQSEQSRLHSRWIAMLASENPVRAVRSAMSRRAERSRWSGPDPAGLLEDERFVASGKSDPRSGMSVANFAEGYVQAAHFDLLVADHLLVPARGPENVVLRKVELPLSTPLPWLVVAADLADGDAREAQQAESLLRKWGHSG